MPQPLGIGLPYIARLPVELYAAGCIDFVEVTPEVLCRQTAGPSGRPSLQLSPAAVERARETCAGLPMVVHGVELSIGSAHGWNDGYVEMLDRFREAWPFLWHSEHLGFQTIGAGSGVEDVGIPLPLPATREAAELVAGRCAALLARYGVPFLLENQAFYVTGLPADPEIGDEAGLLDAIATRSGCGQLLDLHNVHCNAVNLGIEARAVLDRTDFAKVVEVHVAGGSWADGFWMDGHSARVPEEVWDLLDLALARGPAIAGVVFEVLDDHAVRLGPDLIAEELARARRIWSRHRAPH